MRHFMHLEPLAFDAIKRGEKTVEFRLNDPKRKAVLVGHDIEFTRLGPEPETLLVRVVARHEFATFNELIDAYPLSQFSSRPADKAAALKLLRRLYLWANEEKYGVVAFQIERLPAITSS